MAAKRDIFLFQKLPKYMKSPNHGSSPPNCITTDHLHVLDFHKVANAQLSVVLICSCFIHHRQKSLPKTWLRLNRILALAVLVTRNRH